MRRMLAEVVPVLEHKNRKAALDRSKIEKAKP